MAVVAVVVALIGAQSLFAQPRPPQPPPPPPSPEEVRRKAEEEARRVAEEAKRKAEEEKRKIEQAAREADEARKKAEAEAEAKAEEARRAGNQPGNSTNKATGGPLRPIDPPVLKLPPPPLTPPLPPPLPSTVVVAVAGDKQVKVDTLSKAAQKNLRVILETACYGSSHVQAWLDLGFCAAAGSQAVHCDSAASFPTFMNYYGNGYSFQEAVEAQNRCDPTDSYDKWAKELGFTDCQSHRDIKGNGGLRLGALPLKRD